MLAEHRTVYPVKEPNPAGIPARWINFLQRVARLERGRIYTIVLIVPEHADIEPQWAVSDGAKVENMR